VRDCTQPVNRPGRRAAARVHQARDQSGPTKQQIKDALVERFGPAVLAMPDDEGFGLAAYLVPLLVAVLAAAVFAPFHRWRQPSRAIIAPAVLDPTDQERLEHELAAYDREVSRRHHPRDRGGRERE
jgi:cytochrome c-type biogenesis protein CcmH/NrfF